MSQHEQSLLLVAVENVGLAKAALALKNVVAWSFAMGRHGLRPITVEEYAAVWECSVATAFRHQAMIRDAFPGVDLVQVAKEVDRLTEGKRRKLRKASAIGDQLAPFKVVVDEEDDG